MIFKPRKNISIPYSMQVGKVSRRDALRALGVSIALPLLDCMLPLKLLGAGQALGADGVRRRNRFVGCFFGAGAYMPNHQNGDWNWNEGLAPLAAFRGNTVIVRGVKPVHNLDVHWTGTSGFLSGRCSYPIRTDDNLAIGRGEAGFERAGKSLDQYVADQKQTRLRSLHAGWEIMPGHDSAQGRDFSMNYVNCIAWRDERSPITNELNPQRHFTQVFGDGSDIADPAIRRMLLLQKSILDGTRSQSKALQSRLNAADKQKVDSLETGIREIETGLTSRLNEEAGKQGCSNAGVSSDETARYRLNFKLFNRITARALQCDLINSATIMYQNGIGDNSPHGDFGDSQHGVAHNQGFGDRIEKCKRITRMQAELYADLVAQIQNAGILDDTLLMYGSNMSDGDIHGLANIPLLITGAGSDFKFGEEVNVADNGDHMNLDRNRPISDVLYDLTKAYDLQNVAVIGERDWLKTGKATGLIK